MLLNPERLIPELRIDGDGADVKICGDVPNTSGSN